MGLFEKAGRRFEQFKSEAAAAAEEEADFACEACETRLYAHRDRCPECGSDAVVAIESGEEETVDDGGEGTGA